MVMSQFSFGPYGDGKFGVVTQAPLVSSKHDPLTMLKLVDAEHALVAAAFASSAAASASTHCSVGAAVVGPLRFAQFGAVVVGAAVVSRESTAPNTALSKYTVAGLEQICEFSNHRNR